MGDQRRLLHHQRLLYCRRRQCHAQLLHQGWLLYRRLIHHDDVTTVVDHVIQYINALFQMHKMPSAGGHTKENQSTMAVGRHMRLGVIVLGAGNFIEHLGGAHVVAVAVDEHVAGDTTIARRGTTELNRHPPHLRLRVTPPSPDCFFFRGISTTGAREIDDGGGDGGVGEGVLWEQIGLTGGRMEGRGGK
jgi:hypothetical protein